MNLMKRCILYCVVFLAMGNVHSSYANPKDSLALLIKTALGDEKLRYMSQYANVIAEEEPDSAFQIVQFVLDRVSKDQNQTIGMSHLALGEVGYYKRDFNIALKGYNDALPYFSKLNDSTQLASIYNNIGLVHRFRCDFDSAMIAFRHSLEIDEKLNNIIGIAKSYQNIGLVLMQIGEKSGFYAYTNKALAIYEKLNLQDRLAETANNLAVSYVEDQKYDKAESNYLRALAGFRALMDKGNEGNVLINLASLYFNQKKNGDALATINKAIEIFDRMHDYVGLVHSRSLKGDIFNEMNQHDLAIQEYLACEQLNKQILIRDVQISNLQSLADVYKNQKNYEKALALTEQWQAIQDSVYEEERVSAVMDMERLYKDELTRNDVLASKISQQKFLWSLFGGGGLFLVLVLFFVYRYFRARQREKQRLIALDQSVLRANVTPRLLFSSLTSIQHYILENKQSTAVEYIGEYSKLMRLIYQYSEQEYISLENEKEMLELYLSLQSLRLNQAIQYIIHIDDELDVNAFQIPPMLGHPFLELCIEQAVHSLGQEGSLWISFSLVNNLMMYRIHSTIVPCSEQKRHNDSLSNIVHQTTQRIQLINQGILQSHHLMVNLVDLSTHGKCGEMLEIAIPVVNQNAVRKVDHLSPKTSPSVEPITV